MAHGRSWLDGVIPRLIAFHVFLGCLSVIGWTWRHADRAVPSLPQAASQRSSPAPAADAQDGACADRLRREMEERSGGPDLTAEQQMMLRQEIARACP